MSRFRYLFCLLAVGVSLGVLAAPSARAQVLVYEVEFEKVDRSINFSFFDHAFFVVDALGGTGSFLFTFEQDGRDFYMTAADAGELFFAVKPGVERAVIRASALNDSAQSQYLAIGDLDTVLEFNLRGQRISAKVAQRLTGHVLASDSEPDAEFDPNTGLGFAGFAEMKATLNRKRTDLANQENQTVAATIDSIIEDLENIGFEDESELDDDDEEDGDGSGTETGTGDEESDG